MNKTLNTTLTVIAILALAWVIFFAGTMYARSFRPSMMFGNGWNNNNSYGPNMMSGNGGMMGNDYSYNNAAVTPLTLDQTKTAAEKYLANLNNADLKISEIMIFDNNSYVVVKEASTGQGAFELLVDPVSQVAYPEHGPNMMWNTKYSGLNHQYMMAGNVGMMGGGMMSGYGNMMRNWNFQTTPANVTSEMNVSPEQAVEYAQKYLDTNNHTGMTATTDPVQFYGYYTLDFTKGGKIAGMLSVNGYSGQVFLHTWHGTFIDEAEYK